MALDLRRVAEILTPTFRSEGVSGQGYYGQICTGYLVAPDLILTCRHGVEPQTREETYPIQARWRDEKSDNPNIVAEAETEVVWSSAALDAALLRCTSRVDVPTRKQCLRLNHKPSPRQRWASLGFPEAGQDAFDAGSVRKLIDLQGDLLGSCDQRKEAFPLGCDYGSVTANGWKGASGAPIFEDDVIVGVARKALGGVGGQQIEAAPVWQMFEDAEFRRCLGWEDPAEGEKRRQKIGADLSRHLNDQHVIASGIRQELLKLLNTALGPKSNFAEGPLIEALLSKEHHAAVEIVCQCFEMACKEDNEDLAKAVGSLACFVLAATYPLPPLNRSDGGPAPWPTTVVDPDTGTSYGTELYHASRWHSRAHFSKESDGEGMRRGALDLGAFPQSGPDENGEMRRQALALTLEGKFADITRDQFELDLNSRLAARTEIPLKDTGRFGSIERVRDELDYQRETYGYNYYVRHRKPEVTEEQKRLNELVASLPGEYDIITHYLETSPDQSSSEIKTYRLFKDMIEVWLGDLEPFYKIGRRYRM